jgi:hypothetical protein
MHINSAYTNYCSSMRSAEKPIMTDVHVYRRDENFPTSSSLARLSFTDEQIEQNDVERLSLTGFSERRQMPVIGRWL